MPDYNKTPATPAVLQARTFCDTCCVDTAHHIFNKFRHWANYLVSRYYVDRCRDSAAALTYMSLFALVPLLTVLYTMASAIPAFRGLEANIQTLLFENLVPETSAGLADYLSDFSRQAKNLTGFGIAVLVATAVLMLRNIEQAFNLIWRAQGNRGAVSSFVLYWAVLSLAPITIGLGLGASAYLSSFAHHLERWDIIGIGAFLLRSTPYLLEVVGFTLVYAAVPNCRVPLRHALIGGLLAAFTFNIARSVFTKLVAGSSITFIYGAFAAVPLFLLWIYISWNIVLVSALVVHSLSAYQSEAQARRPMLLKALELLELLWRRQASGEALKELELLQSRDIAIDSDSWQILRERLLAQRVITQDTRGHYLLTRDLHNVPLWQLQNWLDDSGDIPDTQTAGLPDWELHTIELLSRQQESTQSRMSISLAKLFDRRGRLTDEADGIEAPVYIPSIVRDTDRL
ncbi:MAG: YihY family inner membrane protein [Congregibacter sp.]